ncbi:MAG: type II toxin-antitoxin system HicA family toxin [SAR324 cluster bacterium]|nr:type II toxin-antitoxin system HicA family toxin [SAR324 cluster bacterium]
MKTRKLLRKILSGSKNIRFSEMRTLLQAFGFELLRTQGSHHIFGNPEIPEVVNLQDYKGQAKPYQVRQVLQLVEKYNLQLEEEV